MMTADLAWLLIMLAAAISTVYLAKHWHHTTPHHTQPDRRPEPGVFDQEMHKDTDLGRWEEEMRR